MSERLWNIAVVGATGLVGETMMAVLEECHFPTKKLFPLASQRSKNREILFKGKYLPVQAVDEFDFSQADIALFSAGSEVSAIQALRATASGCLVIDNSSYFRMEDTIPLIIPEVNSHKLADYPKRLIIANPNCAAIQILVAIKPLYDAYGIERMQVTTYQSVSGAGQKAITELAEQTVALLNGCAINSQVFSEAIAFNVIPQIDKFEGNGYTKEEMKIIQEIKKILNDPFILVSATAVRVPIFYGHSTAIHIETRKKVSQKEARTCLQQAPGIIILDNIQENLYPTPHKQMASKDAVYVGRIREDLSYDTGLALWVVADNIRKGAALNAVQIAELMIKHPNFIQHVNEK